MEISPATPSTKRLRCEIKLCESISPLPFKTPTLFHICVQYVARNIHLVESFYGFPDVVGLKIFQSAKTMGKFKEATVDSLCALRLFSEAYNCDVASCLDLSSSHLAIADYLEHLSLFTHLSELDVSHCGLGDDHELFQHIGQLHRLTKLGAGDNALSDRGIQKLTTPLRMLKRGPGRLQKLDLSGNMKITIQVCRYLKCFTLLSYLDLSGTSVREIHKEKLESDLKMKLSNDERERCDNWYQTRNAGWASDVVSDWIQQTRHPTKSVSKQSLASQFYNRKAKLLNLLNSSLGSDSRCRTEEATQIYLVRRSFEAERGCNILNNMENRESSNRDVLKKSTCNSKNLKHFKNDAKKIETGDDILNLYKSHSSSTSQQDSLPSLSHLLSGY